MFAVLIPHFVVDEALVGLVYQGGGLERVVWALQFHIAGGQSPEFAINQRNQCIGGCLIPTAGCA
jgi:hypothetical protein